MASCTDRLLEHLGGHSLALELAGAYLREFSTVNPQACLDRLKGGDKPGETVKELVRYESTIERALDVQSAKLDESARHALRVAACFAPEDAGLSFLEACGVTPESQQPLEAVSTQPAGSTYRVQVQRAARRVLDLAQPS